MVKKDIKKGKKVTKRSRKIKDGNDQLKLPIYALGCEEIAKLTTKDLFEADPVELYIAISEGKIEKFPDKYWSLNDPELIHRAKSIVEYLLHSKLGWNVWDVEQNISCATFKKNKLVGLYNAFDSSTIKILNSITDYNYSIIRMNCYDKKIHKIRKDLEWFVEKLIENKLTNVDSIIPEHKFTDFNVDYMIKFKYFNPNSSLREILSCLHPELLSKYFTIKGRVRKGVIKGK